MQVELLQAYARGYPFRLSSDDVMYQHVYNSRNNRQN